MKDINEFSNKLNEFSMSKYKLLDEITNEIFKVFNGYNTEYINFFDYEDEFDKDKLGNLIFNASFLLPSKSNDCFNYWEDVYAIHKKENGDLEFICGEYREKINVHHCEELNNGREYQFIYEGRETNVEPKSLYYILLLLTNDVIKQQFETAK